MSSYIVLGDVTRLHALPTVHEPCRLQSLKSVSADGDVVDIRRLGEAYPCQYH